MLKKDHYDRIAYALDSGASREKINKIADEIRMELNPHPSGQLDYNMPTLNGKRLKGMQHKYDQTALFFPSQGQTCHAYCTFCFRWPQFTAMEGMKFASKEIGEVTDYIASHPEVTDLLITGGDPMIMSGKIFERYVDGILKADIPNLRSIRIGTKALAYWPYRFLTDKDSDAIIRSFDRIVKSGRQVAVMAHFNHYAELGTEEVKEAIRRIRNTGAQIRTQSPIFRHINADAKVWSKMWRKQVRLGMIPYYMFVARDTGAQEFFKVSLVEAWEIFRKAYAKVSGLGRTVRGPVMSAAPGKVQVLGEAEVAGEKVLTLRFIQGRNAEWAHRPFFAKFDENAIWIDDLKPAFGEDKFFYEDELQEIYAAKKNELAVIDA